MLFVLNIFMYVNMIEKVIFLTQTSSDPPHNRIRIRLPAAQDLSLYLHLALDSTDATLYRNNLRVRDCALSEKRPSRSAEARKKNHNALYFFPLQ